MLTRSSFSIFHTINYKRCTRIFVGNGRFDGDSSSPDRRGRNIGRKKKKVQEENQSFDPRPYRARNDRLFSLSLPPSSSSFHAYYKLTLMINSISGTSPLLVPFSWLSSAILTIVLPQFRRKALFYRTPQFTIEQDSSFSYDQLRQYAMEAREILTQRVLRHVYDNSAAPWRTTQFDVTDHWLAYQRNAHPTSKSLRKRRPSAFLIANMYVHINTAAQKSIRALINIVMPKCYNTETRLS